MQGQVALVTGASRGLGAASARILAAEGVDLFLTGRDPELLAEMATELRGLGREVMWRSADLTEPGIADKVAAAAEAHFPQIHILVNSAGSSQGGLFWEIPDQVWEDSLALKFMGTLRMIRAVLPGMRTHGYGRIAARETPRLILHPGSGAVQQAGMLFQPCDLQWSRMKGCAPSKRPVFPRLHRRHPQ